MGCAVSVSRYNNPLHENDNELSISVKKSNKIHKKNNKIPHYKKQNTLIINTKWANVI
mgnify:CR=1 FL=1